eukprot:11379873-Alexandrium_andersonii.AAC.1
MGDRAPVYGAMPQLTGNCARHAVAQPFPYLCVTDLLLRHHRGASEHLNLFRPLVDQGVEHMDTVHVYVNRGGDAEEAG